MQQKKDEQRKLTKEQTECIVDRGNNLLVSASAGSGKTFVMIERIKEMIVNREVSVSDILVVTFTKAAAGEMKARLVKGLEEIEVKDDFIKEQLLNVNTASICTLHSFCSKMLKTYFYAIGLDPAFSLIDEEESNNLKAKAFAKLTDNAFVRDDKDYFELLDCFSVNRKEDNFKDTLNKFYEFLLTIVDSDSWFKNTLENTYNTNLDENICANYINRVFAEKFQKQKERADELLKDSLILQNEKVVSYINSLYVNLLKFKPGNTFLQNQKALETLEKIPNMPILKGDFECIKPLINDFKEATKALISDAQDIYLKDVGGALTKKLELTKTHVENLYKYVKEFEQIYSELKKEKVALDFSDLEQNMIKLLQIDEIKASIRSKYKYVFVDEYQDTNAIQEEIIRGVTQENNLFMVGDVKQSIYRFRASEPEIFVNKYNSYENSKIKQSKAIKLNANFRSDKDILDFSNEIFLRAMTPEFGGVNYYKDAMFVKPNAENNTTKSKATKVVKVCIIKECNKEKKEREEEQLPIYSVKNHEEIKEEVVRKAEVEGEVLAKNIKSLIDSGVRVEKKDNKPLTYRDITILSQARGEYLETVLRVLDRFNIPYTSDIKQDIFENVYINALNSLLCLADNRFNDIPLFTVLQSIFSDFTLDELSQIRKENRDKKYFYEAFFNSECHNLPPRIQKKLTKFVELIDELSFYSKFLKVDELIKKAMELVDFENKVLRTQDGNYTITLLNKFVNYVGSKSYNSNLQDYLENVSENEISFSNEPSENACLVTTIHQSKGLEYTAVFLIGAGNQLLNKQSLRDFVSSKELGIGIPYQDVVTRTKSSLLPINAIKLQTNMQNLEEKLRLLYVALTRAVQFLFVIGYLPKDGKIVEASSAKTFMDWVMPVVYAKSRGGLVSFVDFDVEEYISNIDDVNERSKDKQTIKLVQPNEEFISNIQNVIGYKYPYSQDTTKSLKTSVTELMEQEEGEHKVPQVFDTISGELAIRKGNAYHKFLQTINLNCRSIDELKGHLNKLVNNGEITEEDAKLIELQKINRLINSSLFENMLAGKIYRETEFIAKTDSSVVGKTLVSDAVILQGVIDFVSIIKDKAYVIDYKTNNFKREKDYIDKYSLQLKTYASVVEESFGVRVVGKYIYSFTLEKFIEII